MSTSRLRIDVRTGELRGRARRLLKAAMLGAALSIVSPVGSFAAPGGPPDHIPTTIVAQSAPVGFAAAPSETASDRKILAGLVVILFAGFSGLTVAMWRDLGRRVGE